MWKRFLFILTVPLMLGWVSVAYGQINEEYQQATKAAIKKVAPSIVQIVTQGGTDLVVTTKKGLVFRKNLGPTTGVIVSEDGYVISSAFNFINKPTTILVEVPGQNKSYPAKTIATDKSRMLTLLKIDAKGLPVPEHVDKDEIRVGHWALALGRNLDIEQDNPPSVSVGIISALDRVWGKCLQTDAKISPVNYGGPLVDIQGRIQGILVPASPRKEGETAGYEWYDSGIGFAIPMEDVLAVIPRLKKGKDLDKGRLGVQMKSRDMYGTRPVIGKVLPNTAAAKAGLKPGDMILEIDNQPVVRMTQILHLLGPKYEGDTITVKYKRDDKEQSVKIELMGELTSVANSYMGILPMRDDPKLGVEIRYVFPKSPAEKAGLKKGDRIVKYGQMRDPKQLNAKQLKSFKGQFPGRVELTDFLNGISPSEKIQLEVIRNGTDKKEIVEVTLTDFPGTSEDEKDIIPEDLPKVASKKKALEPLEPGPGQPKPAKVDPPKKDDPETGLLELITASGDHKYYVYVHEDYDPNISHALLVWHHLPGKFKKADLEAITETWDPYCSEKNILIVMPLTESRNGWVPSDASFIQEIIRDAFNKYTIDRQRVVAHGMGVSGQMAIHLGFTARDLIRGVATTGSAPTKALENVPNRRLSFFIVAGDRDPLLKAIQQGQNKLIDQKLPTIYREIEEMGRQYLDLPTMQELVRWIDALDRM